MPIKIDESKVVWDKPKIDPSKVVWDKKTDNPSVVGTQQITPTAGQPQPINVADVLNGAGQPQSSVAQTQVQQPIKQPIQQPSQEVQLSYPEINTGNLDLSGSIPKTPVVDITKSLDINKYKAIDEQVKSIENSMPNVVGGGLTAQLKAEKQKMMEPLKMELSAVGLEEIKKNSPIDGSLLQDKLNKNIPFSPIDKYNLETAGANTVLNQKKNQINELSKSVEPKITAVKTLEKKVNDLKSGISDEDNAIIANYEKSYKDLESLTTQMNQMAAIVDQNNPESLGKYQDAYNIYKNKYDEVVAMQPTATSILKEHDGLNSAIEEYNTALNNYNTDPSLQQLQKLNNEYGVLVDHSNSIMNAHPEVKDAYEKQFKLNTAYEFAQRGGGGQAVGADILSLAGGVSNVFDALLSGAARTLGLSDVADVITETSLPIPQQTQGVGQKDIVGGYKPKTGMFYTSKVANMITALLAFEVLSTAASGALSSMLGGDAAVSAIGGVAAGSVVPPALLKTAGMIATTTLLGFGDKLKSAEDEGISHGDALGYAANSSILEGLVFGALSPMLHNAVGTLMPESKAAYELGAKEINKLLLEGSSKSAALKSGLNTYSKAFVNHVAATAGLTASEVTDLLSKKLTNLTNENRKDFKADFDLNHLTLNFVDNFLTLAPISALGLKGQIDRKNDVNNYVRYSVAVNPEYHKTELKSKLETGVIDQKKYDESIKFVDDSVLGLSRIPKETDTITKTKLLPIATRKNQLEEVKKITDKQFHPEIDEEIKRLDGEIGDVLNDKLKTDITKGMVSGEESFIVTKNNFEKVDREMDMSPFNEDTKEVLEQTKKVAKALGKESNGVIVHLTEDSYEKFWGDKGVDSKGRGTVAVYDPDTKIIHVNLSKTKNNSVFHEGAHGIIAPFLKANPEFAKQKHAELVSILEDKIKKGGEDAVDAKFIKDDLESFASQYVDKKTGKEDYVGASTEEPLAEFFNNIAIGKYKDIFSKPENKGILDTIKEWISNLAGKLGLDKIKLESSDDVISFAKKMSKAFKEGKKIEIIDDAKQEKDITPEKKIEEISTGDKGTVPVTDFPIEIDPDVFKLKANRYEKIILSPDDLNGVKRVELYNEFERFKKENGRSPRIWVWMGDQLKRGWYHNEKSGVKHFLGGGFGFATDPKNIKDGDIWASGMSETNLIQRLSDCDYIMLMAGSDNTSFNFSKGTSKVLIKEIGVGLRNNIGKTISGIRIDKSDVVNNKMAFKKFIEISDKILSDIKNYPKKEGVKKDSWGDFLNAIKNPKMMDSAARKTFAQHLLHIGEGVKITKPFNKFIHEDLGLDTRDMFNNKMRENFLIKNNFTNGDIGLLLKPNGKIGAWERKHDTYYHTIKGEVVGVPTHKFNVLDVLPKEKLIEKRVEDASPSVKTKTLVGDFGTVYDRDNIDFKNTKDTSNQKESTLKAKKISDSDIETGLNYLENDYYKSVDSVVDDIWNFHREDVGGDYVDVGDFRSKQDIYDAVKKMQEKSHQDSHKNRVSFYAGSLYRNIMDWHKENVDLYRDSIDLPTKGNTTKYLTPLELRNAKFINVNENYRKIISVDASNISGSYSWSDDVGNIFKSDIIFDKKNEYGQDRWKEIGEPTLVKNINSDLKAKKQDLISDTKKKKFMTEDSNDNYVFFHYSKKDLTKSGIDPNKFGSNALTSKEEKQKSVPVSMYYTEPNIQETGTGNYKHVVRIPKSEVYPFNEDPLKLLPEARKEFESKFPNRAFDFNNQIAIVSKLAAEKGYKMTVGDWGTNSKGKVNSLRAETPIKLTPELVHKPIGLNSIKINDKVEDFKSNRSGGLKARKEEQTELNTTIHQSPDDLKKHRFLEKGNQTREIISVEDIDDASAKYIWSDINKSEQEYETILNRVRRGSKYFWADGATKKLAPNGKRLFSSPNPETKTIAEKYKKDNGLDTDAGEKIYDLNIDTAKKIANAYEEMKHDPFNSEVKNAYEKLSEETKKQYKTVNNAGYKIEIYEGEGEPYANSQAMIDDLKNNKHLFIFGTENGFGQEKITDAQREENPLLHNSGYKDANGKPLLINDLFRGVHDFFGHSERGNSFGAKGKENAWDIHSRMFTPEARRAMTTETRGQNSWVNFGKHNFNEDGSYKNISANEKPFAEQKIGLLPKEFSDLEQVEKFDELTPEERTTLNVSQAGVLKASRVPKINQAVSDRFANQTPEDALNVLRKHSDDADLELKNKTRRTFNKFYKKYVKHLEDVSGNVKEAIRNAGGEEVVMMKDIANKSGGKAGLKIEENDKNIFKGLPKDELKDLGIIIQAKRIIQLDDIKDSKGEARMSHPRGTTSEQQMLGLDAMFNANPRRFTKLEQLADKYFKAHKELLDMKAENGLISQESYEKLKEQSLYSPRMFMQHMTDIETGLNSGKKISVQSSGIKRLEDGSEGLLLQDPRMLLGLTTEKAYSIMAKNDAAKALHKFATENPTNGVVRVREIIGQNKDGSPIFEDVPTGMETISAMIYGQKVDMFMPKEYADEWVASDPAINANFANAVRWFTGANLLRYAATGANPLFALTNPARDAAFMFLTTKAYSKHLPVFLGQLGVDATSVISDAVKRKGRYKEFIEEGGSIEYLTHQGRFSLSRGVDEGVNKISHILGYIGETSELMMRLAMRERGIKNGLTEFKKTNGVDPTPSQLKEIKIKATYDAVNQMDFSQGGDWAKAVNHFVPYFNAASQGLRGTSRAAKRNPALFAYKAVQFMALAGSLAAYNSLQDGFSDVSADEKARNYIIMLPLYRIDDKGRKRWKYVKIAKSQEVQAFSAAAENAVEYAMTGKKPDKQIIDAIQNQLPPLPFITGGTPTTEAYMAYRSNYDSYFDTKLWKGRMDTPNEKQFYKNTPEAYKNIANWSKDVNSVLNTPVISPERFRGATRKMLPNIETNPFVTIPTKGFSVMFEGLGVKERNEIDKSIMDGLYDTLGGAYKRFIGETFPKGESSESTPVAGSKDKTGSHAENLPQASPLPQAKQLPKARQLSKAREYK